MIQYHWCPYRKTAIRKHPDTEGRWPGEHGSSWELRCHRPGNVGPPKGRKGQGRLFPKAFGESVTLPTRWLQPPEREKTPIVYVTWFMVLSYSGPRKLTYLIKPIFFSQFKFFNLSGNKGLKGSIRKGRKYKMIFSIHQPTPAPPQPHTSLQKMPPRRDIHRGSLVPPSAMLRLKGVAHTQMPHATP